MRRIVVTEFISLDGVIEDPGGAEGYAHGGWTFKHPSDAQMKYKLDETMEHDAMLLGRVTYEGFAAAWPKMKDDVGFADKMNSMPKYVVSSTLQEATWQNSTIISGELGAEVAKLKEQPGGDILIAGSASLVQGLVELGLVDEFRLMTFPVVLGSGKRLFAQRAEPVTLKLVHNEVYDSGVVTLVYHPA